MAVKNKIFLFGIDNSGKTSILNRIQNRPNPGDTSPTLSFNIDEMIIKQTEFVVWDAPGQVRYREKWDRGMLEAQILCFIVDLADNKRFDEAKEELQKVLDKPENRGLPLIICFHKVDLLKAKQNLPTAKGMFDPSLFDEREIYRLETSIMSPDSMIKLKDMFVDIIQKSRW
ncbi:MAG: GTP-binding protein [Promethearchaeota archaeon]|nr:MAG: GTP-binding protein [Candidatus Lokiarchaeota archaeon]